MLDQARTITLGHPSYVWRAGQERRFALVQRELRLESACVLDAGCGLGLYVQRFQQCTPHAYGIDVDDERVIQAAEHLPNILQASAQELPFAEGSFDLVFSHEVIEHVEDDLATIREAVRVLAPGGKLALFCPNRGYPFETHGVFWRGRYHEGNIPLVGYLPDRLRRRLCPHARAYTRQSLRQLFAGLPGEIVTQRIIFAGYDHLAQRHPRLARALRAITYALERSPLQVFGLSHWLVFRKSPAPDGDGERTG